MLYSGLHIVVAAENMVTVMKMVENGLIASQTFHYGKSYGAIKIAFHYRTAEL